MNFYVKTVNYINQRSFLKKSILFLDRFLPLIVTLSFYGTLGLLVVQKDAHCIPFLIVPLGAYLCVTFARKQYNSPRPFESLDFVPLIPHSNGFSFPSRHSTSGAVIAVAVFSVYPLLGTLLFFITVLIAATRVLTGVHYIKDVSVGLLLGLGFGFLGFWLFSIFF